MTAIQQLQAKDPDGTMTNAEVLKLLQQFRRDMIRDLENYTKYGVVAPNK